MQIDNLKEKIKPGDIDTASKMVNITAANGYKALKREASKHHDAMLKALQVIIAKREELIQQGV